MTAISSREAAALRAILARADTAGTHASMRMLAASAAHVTLLLSGAAREHKAEVVAKVAWDMGDAMLSETVTRLLPDGVK